MITKSECRKRVRRGVKFLNEHRRGWVWDIQTSRLDLNDAERCVLGQLAQQASNGDKNFYDLIDVEFEDGCVIPQLAMGDEEAIKRGFTLTFDDDEGVDAEQPGSAWAMLNSMWLEEIRAERKRRRAQMPSVTGVDKGMVGV